MPANAEVLVQMKNISKNFIGTKALSDINFELKSGEVHALMGENGAGKSTLMKILAGIHNPDEGKIYIRGKEVDIENPSAAQDLGIAFIHQELSIVPFLTVAENLALGNEPQTRFRSLDRKKIREDAVRKIARVRAPIDPSELMGNLTIGSQQIVEIARAISMNAQILILDEPTAALSSFESQLLFELIAEIRDSGAGLIYISHRMEEVWNLSDRITVFRDGHLIATSKKHELSPEQIVKQMIGRDIVDLYVRGNRKPKEIVLKVENLGDGLNIGPVNFEVKAGEVLGLYGLIGAGRTEITQLVMGANKIATGSVYISGKLVEINSPADAIMCGIASVPEDRKIQGLFSLMSLSDNIIISNLVDFARAGILPLREISRAVKKQFENLSIRASSIEQLVSELSGGNQQKVLLARGLQTNPKILILDEPTRGVDIGAKSEIYKIINSLAESGTAVLMVSSDLPEVLGMSDRILVIREGKVVKEFSTEEASEENVILFSTGLATV
jgi:ribose transport system ATP-binding protein